MKKQLFIIALVSAAFVTVAHAQTTEELAKRVTDFITMEQGHKAKWFDYDKTYHNSKIDLIKKQHNEFKELAKRKITELAKTKDVNTHFSSKLEDMIKLHEKHLAEWKEFGQTWTDKAKSLGEAESAELKAFKGEEEEEEGVGEETETE